MKKNILIIKKDIKDRKSGAPRIVFDQIKFFTKQGYQVHICAETLNPEDIKAAGATPHKTFKWPFDGYKRRKFFRGQAEKLQKKLKPVLTIGHGDSQEDDASYIHNCVHLAHKAIHGSEIASDHPVGLIHQDNFKHNQFKRLVCNSEMMKKDLNQRFGINLDKMTVEYPKYDAEKFYPSSEKRNSMRKELGVNDEELLVSLITSGNFKKRNVQFFLEVMAEINKNIQLPFKVLVAGKNKETKFQEYANANGLGDKVIFAPSIMNVEDYYNAADIFVLPAKIEEFGLSVAEAMICETPVVVSDTVGSGELLVDEYAKSRMSINHDNFISRIQFLMENEAERKKMVELGNKIVKEYPGRYSFDHLLELIK